MARLNVQKEIERGKSLMSNNGRYDINISDIIKIINSTDKIFDLFTIALYLGFARGYKAAKKEMLASR